MNESILIVESTENPASADKVFDKLMSLLETTGCVKDRKSVESDIRAKDWAIGSRKDDRLVFHHSKTDGVSQFCAVVIMFPENIFHGVFAWPENNDDNLQKIATIFERMQKMQVNRTGVKAA
ncbi:MAG: hypothetical protein K5930_00450 [Treponemataceae bacterium]|nr:hypothetical protein [Treponemataceae bacterium]